MKYSKYTGGALDAHNGSSIIGRVNLNTKGYGIEDDYKDDRENILPGLEIEFSDCSRRVSIHDFGNTKEYMLSKLDRMISILQDTRDATVEAWNAYDEFWAKKRRGKYY